jgi:hypothetical protein
VGVPARCGRIWWRLLRNLLIGGMAALAAIAFTFTPTFTPSANINNPTMDLMESNLVALPGDSGCAWYTLGSPVLLGLDSSGDEQSGIPGAYAQPLSSITYQMTNVPRYGQGFSVYVQR